MFSLLPFKGRAVLRDPNESDRSASHLELFFDLVFVVAVIALSKGFHDALLDGSWIQASATFLAVFFSIWWAWMNFTWFSSSHDSNDVFHRLMTFVQMTGALILASGVSSAFTDHNLFLITIGYGVMRVGLIGSWLRVAAHVPDHRRRALRYALGLIVLQALWLGRLGLDDSFAWVAFVVLVAGELAVPAWAERADGRSAHFHADHIEERYGLFTLILLGEAILSASNGLQTSLETGDNPAQVIVVGVLGLATAFGAWWIYFFHPIRMEHSRQLAFSWGYGHAVAFIALAALGAGIHVTMDSVMNHAGDRLGALSFTLPPALFLVSLVGLLKIVGASMTDVRVVPKLAGAAGLVALGLTAGPMVAAVGTVAIITALVIALVSFTGNTKPTVDLR